MRYTYWIFSFIAVLLVGCIGVLYFLPQKFSWLACILIGVALLLLLVLFRSVLMPAQTVRHGLDLISAQDFNNRLVKVGEPESDRLVMLFNTMIDKLRNERLLNQERENFLQLLVEASPMGVVMLDFDGRITLVNPSFLKIAGIIDDNEVMGRRLEELPAELARHMLDVPLGECIEIRQGDIMRYRCYHLSFIQSGFKREFYLLESLTEEVMKAERNAYEKVIRIISHEVNNTMGGVRSVLETLHEFSESDEVKEVIESCDNRCDQMTRFINSYADVVRVPEPVKEPVDINEMIGDMIPFLQGMGSEKVYLRFNPSGENIVADIDLSLIQQVIVNIIKNAIESITMKRGCRNGDSVADDSENSDARNGDVRNGNSVPCDSVSSDSRNGDLVACDSGFGDSVYTDGDNLSGYKDIGHIDIFTGESEGHPMIEIGNNGEPISDAVSRQLFSPFFTTKREGRGIGLTLISEILNRHGATYSLKTTSDGITRFRILFR